MNPLIPREHLKVKRTITEVSKTQNIRLIDVFLLGPTMIWAGNKLKNENKLLSGFLLISGILTITYNGDNYLRNKRTLDEM